MVFKGLCILVLWMEVVSALEGIILTLLNIISIDDLSSQLSDNACVYSQLWTPIPFNKPCVV